MNIQFTLSMPNVGSWNGQWSSRSNFYAVVRLFTGRLGNATAAAILVKRRFYYNFGDGWGASISASEITGAEVRRVRRVSSGFCGYEWMIDSIVENGAIYTDHLRPKPADAPVWPPGYVAPRPRQTAKAQIPVAASITPVDDCPW